VLSPVPCLYLLLTGEHNQTALCLRRKKKQAYRRHTRKASTGHCALESASIELGLTYITPCARLHRQHGHPGLLAPTVVAWHSPLFVLMPASGHGFHVCLLVGRQRRRSEEKKSPPVATTRRTMVVRSLPTKQLLVSLSLCSLFQISKNPMWQCMRQLIRLLCGAIYLPQNLPSK
jgi:hypothetical protein